MNRLEIAFASCLLAASLSAGCATGGGTPARDVRSEAVREAGGRKVTQFEMQDDVQRFTGDFISSVVTAMEPLTEGGEDIALRRAALGRVLIYSSSALDIASGPLPEVNALDMVVFVSLSRATIERYWKPQVFGERVEPLLTAFTTSEAQAWGLVGKVLTAEQQGQLSGLIEHWLDANPGNIRVEMVRLERFSEITGQVAAAQREQARGLLGSVTAATQAVDHGLLLSERAMFLANRFPFLLRLQARLGAQEMLVDSLDRVNADLLGQVPDARPLLSELRGLMLESRETLDELQLLTDSVRPLLESGQLQDTLDSTNRLTADARALLSELRGLEPEARADRFTRLLLLRVGLVGAAWIVLFWAGYYLVKRRTPRHPPRFPKLRASQSPGI